VSLKRIAGILDSASWRQQLAAVRGHWFDLRNGIETVSHIPVAELTDIDPDAARHAVHYEPTSIPKFERALKLLDIDPRNYTFVDFGSGKGRVLLLAAAHPFRKIVGVEISRSLHAQAETNVAAFRRRHPRSPPIECICADARDFELPRGDLLAYFYNPFDAAILAPVAARLVETCEREGRSLAVAYVNPQHGGLFDRRVGMACLMKDSALAVYRNS
jgi:SAM-dependent methyltransferase